MNVLYNSISNVLTKLDSLSDEELAYVGCQQHSYVGNTRSSCPEDYQVFWVNEDGMEQNNDIPDVYQVKWNPQDKLDKEYLSKQVFCALEISDLKNDTKSFELILKKDEKRIIHIMKSLLVFSGNFMKEKHKRKIKQLKLRLNKFHDEEIFQI